MRESQQPRAFFPGAVTDSDKLFPAPGKECPERKLPRMGENGGKLREFRWKRVRRSGAFEIRRVPADEYLVKCVQPMLGIGSDGASAELRLPSAILGRLGGQRMGRWRTTPWRLADP